MRADRARGQPAAADQLRDPHLVPEPLDVDRVLADQLGLEVLAVVAGDGAAGAEADAGDALVGVDLDQPQGQSGCRCACRSRSACAAASGTSSVVTSVIFKVGSYWSMTEPSTWRRVTTSRGRSGDVLGRVRAQLDADARRVGDDQEALAVVTGCP